MAAAVLAVGLVAWGCVVAIQLLRLEELGDNESRSARGLRAAGGLSLGQVATLPLVIAGVAVLAGEGYWLVPGTVFLDPRGFVCRVGVARRDQPVATDRGFRQPYSPECVECVLRTSPTR